ncbi:FtsB family cell division protein [Pedosphaera parvula]|uniref:Septum formation initiator n=1 Tax=Pedosphaera parvula (strain Ellin514) TaxID=320771 RepID=B9XIZ2_PEDPL|nr:septum formation initiator family protein [Pedosphaera parvula]EEF60219.1 Septum formation initiator [Pedosphaera parvula Ellin514]
MKVNLGIWDKLTQAVIFLVMLAFLIGVGIWYMPLVNQNERLRKEILRLDTQLHQEEENSRKIKTSLESQRDPRTVERLARERLGYAKTGETVIRFEEPVQGNVAQH